MVFGIFENGVENCVFPQREMGILDAVVCWL